MAAGDGLIAMTPTSIAYSGTSAGINADGGVDFSAVTSLSLNGVFTGDYDNYLVVANWILASGTEVVRLRYRASGTDASGSDYTFQALSASSTSIFGSRTASQTSTYVGLISATDANGLHTAIYGPYLAQPTAARTIESTGQSGGRIYDVAHTHGLSISYDGLTLYPDASSMTGNIAVFGYEE